MKDRDYTELRARWVAAQDIGRFQELLNAETDDGKYRILAQLLSYEMEQLQKRGVPDPLPPPAGA